MKHLINPIVKNLILGTDYRTNFNEFIESEFLLEVVEFFKKIIEAKLNDKLVDEDWYRETFLNELQDKTIIALYSGLNIKTISNTRGSTSKEVVLDYANSHYDILKETIDSLIAGNDFSISLKLSYKKISVELNSQETLVVINALTIIRSNMRGGAWSSLGKRVEVPLMKTFVKILEIPRDNYILREDPDLPVTIRETDFFFKKAEDTIPVEIKLMGKGNPESADGAIARDSKLFFAYQLSKSNKENLNRLGISFVEFCVGNSVHQLENALDKIGIPYTPFDESKQSIDSLLDTILDSEVDSIVE